MWCKFWVFDVVSRQQNSMIAGLLWLFWLLALLFFCLGLSKLANATAVSAVSSRGHDTDIFFQKHSNSDVSAKAFSTNRLQAQSETLLWVETSKAMSCALDRPPSANGVCQSPWPKRSRSSVVQEQLRDWILSLPDDAAVGLGGFSGSGAQVLSPVLPLGEAQAWPGRVEATLLEPGNDVAISRGQLIEPGPNTPSLKLSATPDAQIRLYFPSLYLPPGAIVDEAVLVVAPRAVVHQPEPLSLRISRNARAFSMHFKDPSFRPSGRVTPVTLPATAVPNTLQEIDITDALRARLALGRESWCFGQGVGLVLARQSVAAESLSFVSVEQDLQLAPRLIVRYRAGPIGKACAVMSRTAFVKSPEDGGYLGQNQALASSGAELVIHPDKPLGFGFKGLSVERGLNMRLERGSLSLTAAQDLPAGTQFLLTAYHVPQTASLPLRMRQWRSNDESGPEIRWVLTEAVVQGGQLKSPNLGAILSPIFQRPAWKTGDGLFIVLKATSSRGGALGGGVQGASGGGTKLALRWRAYYPAKKLQAHRFGLLSALATLPQAGPPVTVSTSFPSSRSSMSPPFFLSEAVRYWRGESAVLGKQRASQSTGASADGHLMSLSHPSVFRRKPTAFLPMQCEGLDLRDKACAKHRWVSRTQYQAPKNLTPGTSCGQRQVSVIFAGDFEKSRTMVWNGGVGWAQCGELPEGQQLHALCGEPAVRALSASGVSTVFMPLLPSSGLQMGLGGVVAGDVADQVIEQRMGESLALGLGSLHRSFTPRVVDPVGLTTVPFTANRPYGPQVTAARVERPLFMSLFRPRDALNWSGNLKRFALDFNQSMIVDQRGRSVFEVGASGEPIFRSGHQSFWSTVADSGSILTGGAAANLPKTRRLYTHLGSLIKRHEAWVPEGEVQAKVVPMHAGDQSVLKALGLASASADSQSAVFDRLQRRGQFSKTSDVLGSFLGAAPLAISYDASSEKNQRGTVFVSSNQGFLHAFDDKTGEELYAFMPSELLSRLPFQFQSIGANTGQPLHYGLDGSWIAWRHDALKAVTESGQLVWRRDGVISAKPADAAIDGRLGILSQRQRDFVMLYGGMGRGGRNVYALDATRSVAPDPNPAPELRFIIRGGESGPYARLGQTWSKPVLTQMRFPSNGVVKVRPVIIFAGGYDAHVFDHRPYYREELPKTTLGNALYIVDAWTGELLWWASRAAGSVQHSDLKYSIPMSVKVLDLDGDGITDRLYFADIVGQMFRTQFDAAGLGEITKIADMGEERNYIPLAQHRFFFRAPSVAPMRTQTGQLRVAIALGSGDVTAPLATGAKDRLFVLYDDYWLTDESSSVPLQSASLPEVVPEVEGEQKATAGARGWQMALDDDVGEKVLSSPLIVNGDLYVATWLPAGARASQMACLKAPEPHHAKLYSISLADGRASHFFGDDGVVARTFKMNGVPPPIQWVSQGRRAVLLFGTYVLPFPSHDEDRSLMAIRKTEWRRLR
jgi:type IV pilus assembly protein PilY1